MPEFSKTNAASMNQKFGGAGVERQNTGADPSNALGSGRFMLGLGSKLAGISGGASALGGYEALTGTQTGKSLDQILVNLK